MKTDSDIKLSRRQKVLLARLTSLAESANSRKLPVEVLEILGFGSFFRAKENPKDVDLLIRCTRENQPFSLFRQILEHICREVQYQHDFDRPLEAWLTVFDSKHRDMLPGVVSLDEERALFADWLAPYSWPMLFPKAVEDLPAWDDPIGFTRRLVRRTLPNLNIAYYIYPETTPDQIGLRAGFTELVWSRGQPDVRQNVLDALAPSRVLDNTKRELQNFDRQIFLLAATLKFLQSEIQRLIGQAAPSHSEARIPACGNTLLCSVKKKPRPNWECAVQQLSTRRCATPRSCGLSNNAASKSRSSGRMLRSCARLPACLIGARIDLQVLISAPRSL